MAYKKQLVFKRFTEGKADGLIEMRSRVLDENGNPSGITVHEVFRRKAPYLVHELQCGDERLDMRNADENLVSVVEAWISERIAA